MKRRLIFILSVTALSGCSLPLAEERGCPPETMIEWIDTVNINDVQYEVLEFGNYKVEENNLGEVLGEVTYKMAGTACTDHKTQNGDAAFLEVGTEIYEFEGYKSDFRVVADGKAYEVMENDQAKTIGNLYDIEGKVQGMSLRSSYDGSYVMDLKEEHWKKFIEEFLALEYVGFDEIYEKIGNEEGTFLEIHLKDGSSVRINYWTEANVLNPGAIGNQEMQEIITLYK